MSSTFKKTLLASLVVPVALGAQSASAALITEWGYSVDSSFDNWTATDGQGEITHTDEGGTSTLSWGIVEDQSSISINDVSADGGLITGGDYVQGGTFTHDNNVLPHEGLALDSFDLTSALTLTPVGPEPGAPQSVPPLTFMSFFNETGNSSGNCLPEANSVCDDIFTLDNVGELGFSEVDGDFQFVSQSFTVEDYAYTVFLDLVGLGPLSDEACAAAGATSGCIGFLTEEGTNNEFETRFRITAEEVPEPGTLALLGMGLAGLGLARRKRAAQV